MIPRTSTWNTAALPAKSGAWYSYNGERMGQGKEAAKQYLLDNPQVADEIDRIIRDTLAVGTEEIVVIGEEVTEEE